MAARSPTVSAGIALLRRHQGEVEVLLVHPGGPFWANKDEHAWSIPKGEITDGDDPAATAQREFTEETGHPAPAGRLLALPEIRLSSAKRLRAFAAAGNLDPTTMASNTFEMEWPPRSGRTATFPEVDRAAWFTLDRARSRLHKGQVALVDHLGPVVDTVLGP